MSKIGYVKNSLDNVLFLLEKENKSITLFANDEATI